MRRGTAMEAERFKDPLSKFVDIPAYEIFFIISEQLKYWADEGCTPQEAMEAMEIPKRAMYGIGFQNATWMDVAIAMAKRWKYNI